MQKLINLKRIVIDIASAITFMALSTMLTYGLHIFSLFILNK